MKVLAVKFSENQLGLIGDVSIVVGVDKSKVARAAMQIGLRQIASMVKKDLSKAVDLVVTSDAKSKYSLLD